MDVHDYLIDQNGLDWQQILSVWADVLPERFTLWLVNRFGDIFAVYEDESVNWLAVDTGSVTRVASNRDEFCDLMDVGDHGNDWLMIPLVDACVANGMLLAPGQCYGYKVLPILGGEYDIGNISGMDIEVYHSFAADICRQTRDLPVGTRVHIVIR